MVGVRITPFRIADSFQRKGLSQKVALAISLITVKLFGILLGFHPLLALLETVRCGGAGQPKAHFK